MEKFEISTENKEEKEKVIRNTKEFEKALEAGRLAEAEDFLNEISSKPEKFPQYDDRWLDHRQKYLFDAFCAGKDWGGAKRLVEATKGAESKAGRIKRLVELSGMKYEEI